MEDVLVTFGHNLMEMSRESKDQNAATIFNMWLMPDHGLVNRMGHGQPSTRGYRELTNYAETKPQFLRWKFLENAIRAPFSARPCEVFPIRGEGEDNKFAAIFFFKHAPRDMGVIFSEQKADVR